MLPINPNSHREIKAMPKKSTTKKRTKVKDLSKKKKELSAAELKGVKGGLTKLPGKRKPPTISL
jgi:hypothetical protein